MSNQLVNLYGDDDSNLFGSSDEVLGGSKAEPKPVIQRRNSIDDEVDFGDDELPMTTTTTGSHLAGAKLGPESSATKVISSSSATSKSTSSVAVKVVDPDKVALYITDLAWHTSDAILLQLALDAGIPSSELSLSDIYFAEFKVNGKSKGIAYVEFKSPEPALRLQQALSDGSLSEKDGSRTVSAVLCNRIDDKPRLFQILPNVNAFKIVPGGSKNLLNQNQMPPGVNSPAMNNMNINMGVPPGMNMNMNMMGGPGMMGPGMMGGGPPGMMGGPPGMMNGPPGMMGNPGLMGNQGMMMNGPPGMMGRPPMYNNNNNMGGPGGPMRNNNFNNNANNRFNNGGPYQRNNNMPAGGYGNNNQMGMMGNPGMNDFDGGMMGPGGGYGHNMQGNNMNRNNNNMYGGGGGK